ncbi:lovastatin nonaketide synthase [Aspergillus fijiensis CBS 313.89]|uniref:Lovastatin nonaketide synthase n=1 Tax=Aspergillus fijiensis CBS 313.89 TaxID=1448319 RepID=A0A8G1RJM1_9EURO|nr:lovastatin nonaketide synthase [Aspergillus fijiensis CBS 313.89]RAK74480.1 lovastatin nonaketide synthase [Aspergillus fijiensis CBS 313.89]
MATLTTKQLRGSEDSRTASEYVSPVFSTPQSPSPASSLDGPNLPAVIGYACRVAGADRPSKLWENIIEQKDVRRKIPGDRFNVDTFYHPDGTHKGATNAKHGYFLDQDLGAFDRTFFRISGKEAEAMDPQQRLLLEVVFEALEDAGISLEEINGSRTSVLCGAFTNDYNAMLTKDLEYYPKYTVTGTGNAILANRISYAFNLKGMSLTIDTACSSSLVGFHLGAQAILNGECEMAIIVGSALHFDPNIFITMTDLGMLSQEGRCRAFDAGGKGYARGEGICAVILRGQMQAEMHGDHIRALVRATGSNHDGMTQGITLPSSEAQEALIRTTYQSCGLDPADTQYVEAHGTGTARGDPLEMRAIGACFSSPRRSDPLYVGSVKSNIGHAEGASGLAGLIKASMALETGQIPPNMHFKHPNPEIAFADWQIEVPTRLIDFPSNAQGARRVSINSFGYGGSNAHVILESYDQLPNVQPTDPGAHRPYLVPLTSHTEKAGKLMVEKLGAYLDDKPSTRVVDLAHSLTTRRTLHDERSFAVGASAADIRTQLSEGLPAWTKVRREPLRLGFVFTGQGAQWHAMGRQLLEQCPFFRHTLERADRVLATLPDKPEWSIVTELTQAKETSRLGETRLSQPICTALQLAILDLLKSWGIIPQATVGHSSGEVAGAYAAGILTFENAMYAAYYRGLHMSSPRPSTSPGTDAIPGAMLAVGLGEAEAMAETESYRGRAVVAAVNSPSSVTLSGDEDAIVEIKERLDAEKVFARRLQVQQAFHSHHMDPLAPAYEEALRNCPGFATTAPACRFFSSVTARVANPDTMGPQYWSANMTGTVRFSDALIGVLLDDLENPNVDALVEIGPHPALKGPARQVMKSVNMDLPYFASLSRGVPDYEGILALAGQLFQLGYPVDLTAVNSDTYLSDSDPPRQTHRGQRIPDLPLYAWDHSDRYWAETRLIKEHRLRPHHHPILGAKMPGSIEGHVRWRNYLRTRELPWLVDHMVDGKVTFPAAGYVTLAIEAALRMKDTVMAAQGVSLRNLSIKSALVLDESDMGSEVLVDIRPQTTSAKSKSDTWLEFTIFSYNGSLTCAEHCTGLISISTATTADGAPSRKPYRQHTQPQPGRMSTASFPAQSFYTHLRQLGLEYGEHFQLLTGTIESGAGFSSSMLTFEPEQYASQPTDLTVVHPTMLDAAFHTIFAALEGLSGRTLQTAFVPTFVQSLDIFPAMLSVMDAPRPLEARVASSAHFSGPRAAVSDVDMYRQGDGEALLSLAGLRLTSLSNGRAAHNRSLFFRTRWQPAFDQLSEDSPALQDRTLAGVLDLFLHQHPDTKILHFTPDINQTQRLVGCLVDQGSERRRFRSITPVATQGAFAEELELVQREQPGCIVTGEPEPEAYDLVIVGEAQEAHPLPFLRDEGYVISHGSAIDETNLKKRFQCANVEVWQRTRETRSNVRPLLLAIAPTPSRRTLDLASHIKAANPDRPVSCLGLQELVVHMTGVEDVVVLASLDRDLLSGPDPQGELFFEATRALLIRPDVNVLWLLQDTTAPRHVDSLGSSMIVGLARTARSENPSSRIVTLDLPVDWSPAAVVPLLPQLLDPEVHEDEFHLRDQVLSIPRIENDDGLNSKVPGGVGSGPRPESFSAQRPMRLAIGQAGLLETLVWEDDVEILNEPLPDDEIEIEVKASALNFRDVAAAMGIIDDHRLGDECAGIVRRVGQHVDPAAFQPGDRVVALRPGRGAHRSVVRNPACHCFRLGPMPFEQATALPLILTTAYYSLVETARLQPGETVLIHCAAGGVGQMAIQIAQQIGAKIIATVGSPAKRDLLQSRYGLTEAHILSSRDASFVDGVMQLTDGRGVDVVLNSLSGKLLHASWNSLATFGRFVEIGKRDIHENTLIEMDPFRRNVLFASVDMVTIYAQNRALGARIFDHCCNMVHEGRIQLPATILALPYSEAVQGFRLLQMGRHTGKVVLVAEDEGDQVPVSPPTWNAVANRLSPDKTYLLVGGLGGLGRTLTEWLVQRQAKRIAFLSRSGADRPEAQATVAWLRARGIAVSVHAGDVADPGHVQACIKAIPDLGGVVHAAMVLADAPLERMSYAQWHRCVQPKVRGAYNLHCATVHCPLDFFVCFSSISAFFGSKAQANYAAANVYLDSLVRYRRQLGLSASSMNCGRITGVGVAAADASLERFMVEEGFDGVNRQELLYQIEEAIFSADHPAPLSGRGTDMSQTLTGVTLERDDVYWAQRSIFRNLYRNHDVEGQSRPGADEVNLSVQLARTIDLSDRVALLMERFVDKVSVVLGLSPESLKPADPVYGLDSLVAVELRNWFTKSVGVDIALFDVLGSPSIQALVEKAIGLFDAQVQQQQQQQSVQSSSAPSNDDQSPTFNKNLDSQDHSTSLQIPKADCSRPLPMSTFQNRLWVSHRFAADKSRLNLAITMHLRGQADHGILEQALSELIARNPILRTAYEEGEAQDEQRVMVPRPFHLGFHDLSKSSPSEGSTASLETLVGSLKRKEMRIEEGEVLEATLVQRSSTECALVLIMHHICTDRSNSQSFVRQLAALYDALRQGRSLSTIPAPKVTYADFTLWHNHLLTSPSMGKGVEYWKQTLAGMPASCQLLPFAKGERPSWDEYGRETVVAALSARQLKRMKRICSQARTSPFHFLLAAFRAFLHRYTADEDLTILMVDGNRPHADLGEVLGFFVNMAPIRCRDACDGSFETLLKTIQGRVLEAMAHSHVPFDVIVAQTQGARTPAHFPVSQVLVNYQQPDEQARYQTTDFTFQGTEVQNMPTGCELSLQAREDAENGLQLELEYATALYDDGDMRCFFDNFQTFVTSLIQDHRQSIPEVRLAGTLELERLALHCWNSNPPDHGWQPLNLPRRIVDVAETQPSAIAITTSAGEAITYQDLVASARRVAFSLQNWGIGPGQVVGILASPGIELVTAMLGALFNRCGYVPLDPTMAVGRLAYIVGDSGMQLLLVDAESDPLASSLGRESPSLPNVMSIENATRAAWPADLPRSVPTDPFYMMYTSGSTGTPKGVPLTQENVGEMLAAMQARFNFTREDRFLHQISPSFDLSVVELFSPLCVGAKLCIATKATRSDPRLLGDYLQQESVTVTYFTPTQFALVLEHSGASLVACPDYRIALLCGERLPTRLAEAFNQLACAATLYNAWGPTEAAVQTTIHRVQWPADQTLNIPIGHAVGSCRHYIVDAAMNPLPVGFVGEICIGGSQVARGYWNRAESNRQQFLRNPFASPDDHRRGWTRLFRTGDLGRFLPDGQLEFLGRIAGDKQIKLRGFRIDLGEIEHVLHQHSGTPEGQGIVDLAVIAQSAPEDADNLTDDRWLVAFIVPKQAMPTEAAKRAYATLLHTRAKPYLNSYMLPATYQFVDQLPTTASGKTDRRALGASGAQGTPPHGAGPAAASTSDQAQAQDRADEEVSDRTMAAVTRVWQEVLRLDHDIPVEPTSNFFDMGGSSTLLLRLQGKLQNTLSIPISLQEMVRRPTLVQLVELVNSKVPREGQPPPTPGSPEEDVVDWAQETTVPDEPRYHPPSAPMSPGGHDILMTGAESFTGIHLLAQLLTSQPSGTIHLLGTHHPLDHAQVFQRLQEYNLLNATLTPEQILTRLRMIPGSLAERSHFGLLPRAFEALGRSIATIYHLASEVSLLKTYHDLKHINTASILPLIELARWGGPSPIHYLSTWSVPHLQLWTAPPTTPAVVHEASAGHFKPPPTADQGYFKSRWAAEMLLTHAAARGFPVTIYRASAVTGNPTTGLPAPAGDFVRSLILDMVRHRLVPRFARESPAPFVVDLVPVNYLTALLAHLAQHPRAAAAEAHGPAVEIFHLTNPTPLPLDQLPGLTGSIRGDATAGRVVSVDDWLAAVSGSDPAAADADEDEQLRVQVAGGYFRRGHQMFALDRRRTDAALGGVKEGWVDCPPVDANYLRALWLQKV